MQVVNAVSRIRFASARPQRVRLSQCGSCAVEMLCMEAGQKAKVASGPWAYYVVMGTAQIAAGQEASSLSTGQLASTGPHEPHSVANAGEGRLVCLAFGPA